jgi:ribA/ribD-fused uncharacterized protein
MSRKFLGLTTPEIRKLSKRKWAIWRRSMVAATGYVPTKIPPYKYCWCCERKDEHRPDCRNPWDVGCWLPEHEEIHFYGWEPRTWWPLSNFYNIKPFELNGRIYSTTEHYYQACKAQTIEEHEKIRNAENPNMAKYYGKMTHLPHNWEAIKYDVMKLALKSKFGLPELRSVLLGTGSRVIHEENPKDMDWSYHKGRGKDLLGKALLEIREEIVAEMFSEGIELVILRSSD